MALYPKIRDIHLWIGLILLAPLLAIAATGVMLNHEHAIGLKPGPKPGLKPVKSLTKSDENILHATASLPSPAPFRAAQGAWSDHAGAIDSALAAAKAEWGEIALDRIELKEDHMHGFLVKVKASEEANVSPEEIVWSVEKQAIAYKVGDKADGWQWNKIVHDLHTGKIFHKAYGFWWSDVTGVSILALSLTGVVLYAIPLFKRAQKKKPAAGVKPVVKAGAGVPALARKSPQETTETAEAAV